MSVPLVSLAEVNPATPAFDRIGDEERIPFVPLECVWPDGRADLSRVIDKKSGTNGYTRFHGDDVLLPKITPTFEAGRSFQVTASIAVGAATTELHVLRPESPADGRFIAYLCRSEPFLQEGAARLQGVGNLRRISADFVRRFPVLIKDPTKRTAIADFLDRETARIDTLIEKQEKLIEILRERRLTEISAAVTKGIDGRALAPTASPYIDRAPSHWTVSRFGLEVAISQGQVDPTIPPWDNMVLIAPNHIESSTGRLLPLETAVDQGAESGKYLAEQGQVIYSKIRPALNKVAVAPDRCLISADMYAFSSIRGDSNRYLMYYMLSGPVHSYASAISARVKMPKINREELSAAPYLRPPRSEQDEIVEYLDRRTAQIDHLITKANRFIELAKERRSALITAAVTGQIEVGEEAPVG